MSNRRSAGKIGWIFERRLPEPRGAEQREVRRVPKIGPVGDIALADGCLESRRLRDDPVGQQTTPAAARDSQASLVDVSLPDDLVQTSHQILVVVAWILELNAVAEILAVIRAPAGIRVQHHISLRRHPLELVREGVPIRGMWTPVDLQNQGI